MNFVDINTKKFKNFVFLKYSFVRHFFLKIKFDVSIIAIIIEIFVITSKLYNRVELTELHER